MSEVSTRLRRSIDALYAWVREQRKVRVIRQEDASLAPRFWPFILLANGMSAPESK